MLERRDIGRSLRLDDEVLQTLVGRTITGVSYTEHASGSFETVTLSLDNGLQVEIESQVASDDTSYHDVRIQRA